MAGLRTRKARRGNLLTIVLLSAVIAAMLSGVLLTTARNLTAAKTRTADAGALYSGIAMADIFEDAFLYDLGSQYVQRTIPIGTTSLDTDFYEELISGTSGVIDSMNLIPDGSGGYEYLGDAQAVGEDVTFQQSGYGSTENRRSPTPQRMEQRFEALMKKIRTFSIKLANGLVADTTSDKNELNWRTGDRYYLQPISFTLDFNIGSQHYHREYLLTNLYAEFSHNGELATCNIRTDEADLLMQFQKLSKTTLNIQIETGEG